MKNNIILLFILIFSFILYTYKLNEIPNSIYVDEATVGYNALSILNTSTDEYGQKFPIYFRFFNAYTPGLYVYFIIPLIKIFGLSAFSIRILSAISGTLSVYIFYKTLKLLSNNALIGSLFYSIIPWTVFNSRLGYEVMFAATLFNIGCYFIIKNLNKISYIGLFFISISTYAAHTQRYLAPILLLAIFLVYKNIKIKHIIFLLITQIPNIILMFTNSFWIKNNSFLIEKILIQFITYLSPKTLFFSLPDIDLQHQIPQISVLYWWMFFPLVFGIKKIFSLESNTKRFIIIWIILSIIPASLSGEFISIQRALPLLFPIMLVVSLGLSKNIYINIILVGYSIITLFRSYYILFPKTLSLAWNYGYQELSQIISSNPTKIYLIDNSRNPRNYILPLYYLKLTYKYNINDYYSAPILSDHYSYDNMIFKPISWGDDLLKINYIVSDGLSVSIDQAKDHNLKKIKSIITPINETALEIFEVIH